MNLTTVLILIVGLSLAACSFVFGCVVIWELSPGVQTHNGTWLNLTGCVFWVIGGLIAWATFTLAAAGHGEQ